MKKESRDTWNCRGDRGTRCGGRSKREDDVEYTIDEYLALFWLARLGTGLAETKGAVEGAVGSRDRRLERLHAGKGSSFDLSSIKGRLTLESRVVVVVGLRSDDDSLLNTALMTSHKSMTGLAHINA